MGSEVLWHAEFVRFFSCQTVLLIEIALEGSPCVPVTAPKRLVCVAIKSLCIGPLGWGTRCSLETWLWIGSAASVQGGLRVSLSETPEGVNRLE